MQNKTTISKIINFGLILTSLLGYLEWGEDQKMFLFQSEMDILAKLFTDPGSVIHPFILLPLIGQILLLITLFQKRPGKILTFLGLGGIAILLLLMFAIGLMSTNVKIVVSTIPFIVTAILAIQHHRRNNSRA